MKYDLSKQFDVDKFKKRSDKLLEGKKKVTLTEFRGIRSNLQNNYFYACLNLFAIEFGYREHEAKTLLKRNCPFMRYEKNGEWFLKSTADLDKKEMSDFMEWFMTYSAQAGFRLMSPDEYYENQFYVAQEIEKNKDFL